MTWISVDANAGWKDAVERARDVAAWFPEWKTNRIEFFNDMADTIEEAQHVTPRQMEVIEDAEADQ